MEANTQSLYEPARQLVTSELKDGIVIMCIDSGVYYTLHDVAARIWQMLQESPKTTNQIIDLLMEEYDVTREQCTKDVTQFMSEMTNKKLLVKQE